MIDENAVREEALDSMIDAGYGEAEALAAIDAACNLDGVIYEDAKSLVGAAILRISVGEIEEEED
jgi:hypothetical protein